MTYVPCRTLPLHGHLAPLFFFRLAREQARVRDLKSGNQQLEEQRVELVERLQAMLQAHWDEASQLLSSTLLPPNPQVGTTPESSCPAQINLPSMAKAHHMCPVPLGTALIPVLRQE